MAVGKANCVRLASYSRPKLKREPLIALGSYQGVLNFCVRKTPLRGERRRKKTTTATTTVQFRSR